MNKKNILIFLLFLVLTIGQLSIPNNAIEATELQKLNSTKFSYTIQNGDTLSEISELFNVPLSQLMQVNNLNSNLILPGDILIIPEGNDSSVLSRGIDNRDDLLLLARAIHAEARGESFAGQVAVGAVILNRVASNEFPNTIREVIMQNNRHTYQFRPVADGSINLEPNEMAIEAARRALEGEDPTNGALFFYNPTISTDRWITTLPVITTIGNHVFADKL